VQHGRVGERGEQHRPEGVQRGPAGADVGGLARVDADLHGRGGAHRATAERPPAVEGFLHRLVAGQLQDAVGRADRVGGAGRGMEPGGGEALVQGGRVGADGLQEGGEVGARRAGQFDLAAGFDRDGGTGRERLSGGRPGQAERGVRAECGGEHRGIRGRPRLGRAVQEPLELDTQEPRWTVLETHGPDVGLGIGAVAQDRRPGVGTTRLRARGLLRDRGSSGDHRCLLRHASDATLGPRQFRVTRC
jgi:hypothetical protein